MFRLLCVGFALVVLEVSGHGMMLAPVQRSSLWRVDPSAPANYNDNELFCGGAGIHHGANNGKCGLCGDNYANPSPRANEHTGLYGGGKIVAEFKAGQLITTEVALTANHKGKFEYSMCQILDESKPESGEKCFKPLKFADGSLTFTVESGIKKFNNKLELPAGFRCPHCVLRWQYTAGNNWGICDDGVERPGCGPQETFRNCADIKIV